MNPTSTQVQPACSGSDRRLRSCAAVEWNYGAFPQTWEQPEHAWKGLEGHKGDNDPVDIVDLSGESVRAGPRLRTGLPHWMGSRRPRSG